MGRVLCWRTRDETTFPAAWKERRDIGRRSFGKRDVGKMFVVKFGGEAKEGREEVFGGFSGFFGDESEALPDWIRIAEVRMKRVWIRKERIRTQRFRGVKIRWRVLKNRAPRRKEEIAVRDFEIWIVVVWWGKFERPRAAKIVLPVFWIISFGVSIGGGEMGKLV